MRSLITTFFFGFLILGLLAIYAIRIALTITGKRTIGPYVRFLGASVMVWCQLIVDAAAHRLLGKIPNEEIDWVLSNLSR